MGWTELLTAFASQINIYFTNDEIEYIESLPRFEVLVSLSKLEEDKTNYHIVDGEEGDYGEIIYKTRKYVICHYENHGGDDDNYKFTGYAVEIFMGIILLVLNKRVSNLDVYYE